MAKTILRKWEYLEGGRILINDGEKIVKVHPNMPLWIVSANMDRSANMAHITNRPDRSFVFSITDRCNIRCDFCCHPYLDSALKEEDCIRMVEEACALPFDEICVTGGEPYIRRALVYKLASICKSRGRLFGSITNGFWAKDRAKAFRLAEEMVDHGVARVTFSWDPSHGEFIAPQTVQNGIDACMHAGMRVCLTGSFKQKDDCHENYGIDVSAYKEYANFSVVDSYVAPAGRGKALEHVYRTAVSPKQAASLRCPGYLIQELVVYARDGLTQPCCSVHAGYDMPQLRIGDWRTQSVAELLTSQQGDSYYRIIVDGGFALLYKIIEERAPDIYSRLPAPQTALSSCHLCEMVMVGPDAPRIRQICDEYVIDRLIATISANSKQFTQLFQNERVMSQTLS
jgi:hypothetical protein